MKIEIDGYPEQRTNYQEDNSYSVAGEQKSQF